MGQLLNNFRQNHTSPYKSGVPQWWRWRDAILHTVTYVINYLNKMIDTATEVGNDTEYQLARPLILHSDSAASIPNKLPHRLRYVSRFSSSSNVIILFYCGINVQYKALLKKWELTFQILCDWKWGWGLKLWSKALLTKSRVNSSHIIRISWL